jgi:spoIIIJ-associated protein
VVVQRGGRRRAAQSKSDHQGDPFRDALTQSLAQALGADLEDVVVTVEVAGAPVASDLLPLTLRLSAPADAAASGAVVPVEPAADEQPVVAPEPEAVEGAASRSGRGVRAGRDATPASAPRVSAPAARESASEGVPVSAVELDEEAEAAADLLEGLLDAMDLPGDLRISVQEAHAEVEVVGLEEGVLIGRRGQTLEAIQELVRTAMQRRFERRSRVMVDVDGYRARRLEKLLERVEAAVEEALATGESQRLEPMDSIERRLVHQRVATFEGVTSQSHGREPARRIVIEAVEED